MARRLKIITGLTTLAAASLMAAGADARRGGPEGEGEGVRDGRRLLHCDEGSEGEGDDRRKRRRNAEGEGRDDRYCDDSHEGEGHESGESEGYENGEGSEGEGEG